VQIPRSRRSSSFIWKTTVSTTSTGRFPGANGLANAAPEQTLQRDHDGTIGPYLTVWNGEGKPNPDFPRQPNPLFRIDAPPVSKNPEQMLLSPIQLRDRDDFLADINAGRLPAVAFF
jgi:hypothetical protein